jgi:hypothetical protein
VNSSNPAEIDPHLTKRSEPDDELLEFEISTYEALFIMMQPKPDLYYSLELISDLEFTRAFTIVRMETFEESYR